MARLIPSKSTVFWFIKFCFDVFRNQRRKSLIMLKNSWRFKTSAEDVSSSRISRSRIKTNGDPVWRPWRPLWTSKSRYESSVSFLAGDSRLLRRFSFIVDFGSVIIDWLIGFLSSPPPRLTGQSIHHWSAQACRGEGRRSHDPIPGWVLGRAGIPSSDVMWITDQIESITWSIDYVIVIIGEWNQGDCRPRNSVDPCRTWTWRTSLWQRVGLRRSWKLLRSPAALKKATLPLDSRFDFVLIELSLCACKEYGLAFNGTVNA